MFKRKGITPVIAIVLLLLITVGAVTVVYSQFESLTSDNDATQKLEEQQQLQQSSYTIVGIADNSGQMDVTVKNTGKVTIDLTNQGTLLIGKDGSEPVATSVLGGTSCGATFGQLKPGETSTCSTGVDWPTPNDGKSTTVRLMVGEVVKATHTCTADGSGYC